MVRRSIFATLLCPFFLFSGEFTATVDRDQIHLGESIVLQLTLKDASAKGIPALGSLKKAFQIHSQQQASNMVMTNGKTSSSLTWKITLIPHEAGNIEIPSISMETSDGILSSEPVLVHVSEGALSGPSESSDADDIVFQAEVSNDSPYKNEPFLYTAKLISKKSLINLQFNKPDIKDAMVESNGEPKIYHKIANGMRVDIIEFSYLITPLKAGILTIPSASLQGGIPVKKKIQSRSFFDQDFDPFLLMQGFDQVEPFSIKTKSVDVDVQPVVLGMLPWLPARSFHIEEIWDESQTLRAGDPISRSFNISAEGLKSGQLPSLNDLQVKGAPFQIYADSPELGEEIKNGKITSYRKEIYTLIPEQAGSLTLPEISVSWWDVLHQEKRTVRIPARALQVLPATKLALPNPEPSLVAGPQVTAVSRDPILYMIIAGLIFMLFAAVCIGILLHKKIARLTELPVELQKKKPQKSPWFLFGFKKTKKVPKKDKKEKLPDLNPT